MIIIVILDFFLPTHKIPNGHVTLYDYLGSGNKTKNLSVKMRWPKYFGIYHQSKNLVMRQTQCMGILEMILTELNATDDIVILYSTLNHIIERNTGKCKILDG